MPGNLNCRDQLQPDIDENLPWQPTPDDGTVWSNTIPVQKEFPLSWEVRHCNEIWAIEVTWHCSC